MSEQIVNEKHRENDINDFLMKLSLIKNKKNFKIGKYGEFAVSDYLKTIGISSSVDLSSELDNGVDLMLKCNGKTINAQIKTISEDTKGKNIPLNKNLYDSKLEYYNHIRQDVFILVKQLSEYEYSIQGFITHEDALKCYTNEIPIKHCYCINQKYLTPIEQIIQLFN